MTTIFTSDFHGTKELTDKVKELYDKYPNAELVFGGDYIDGRKNSKEVVNFVRRMQVEHNAIVLKGNHEDMLETFTMTYSSDDLWLKNGGKTTIKSLFGRGMGKVTACKELLRKKLYDGKPLTRWINQMRTCYYNDDACFVHAFINVNNDNDLDKAIDSTSYFDRLWSRDFVERPINYKNKTGKAIIFGHTPTCYYDNKGMYDNVNVFKSAINDEQKNKCPIYEYKAKGCSSLIACDGGCHGGNNKNTGNVVVVKEGKVIDWLN